MHCLPGMSYIMKSVPKRHTLFLPETLVDAMLSEKSLNVGNIAAELKLTHTELMEQQKEGLKQAQKTKAERQSESTVNKSRITDQNPDVTRQQEEYERLKSEKEAKERSNLSIAKDEHSGSENVRGTGTGGYKLNVEGSPGRVDDSTKASGFRRGSSVDSYGSHGAGPEGRNQNPQHQVNHEYDMIRTPPAQRHLSQPEPRKEMAHGGDTSTFSRFPNVDQHRGLRHSDVDPPRGQEHGQGYHHDDKLHLTDDQDASAQKSLVLAATGVNDSLIDSNLAVGSLIQIQSPEPLRYGTIKWIGLVQTLKGKMAGIELVITTTFIFIV